MDAGREVEITQDLVLDERERRLLDVHSVLNILTIVVHDIEVAGTLVADVAAADLLTDELLEWGHTLADRQGAMTQFRRVPEMREHVLGWMTAQRPRVPEAQRPIFEHHLDNLESVFDILTVRVAELIERAGDMNRYDTFSLEQLRANLHATFKAIEKNSLGRYHIAFSPADRDPGDYLMEIDLRSPDGRSIRMPAVFEDAMRDLACNARKYTAPGGSIRVTLQQDDDGELFLEVEDDGRGIPEDEIDDVVVFGYRSPSLRDRTQTGGGFGLTKAYFAAKKFGGRMWIRSSPGVGTRVTIRLPRPPAQSTPAADR